MCYVSSSISINDWIEQYLYSLRNLSRACLKSPKTFQLTALCMRPLQDNNRTGWRAFTTNSNKKITWGIFLFSVALVDQSYVLKFDLAFINSCQVAHDVNFHSSIVLKKYLVFILSIFQSHFVAGCMSHFLLMEWTPKN